MIRDLYWFAFLQSKCIFCSSQMGQRACKGSWNDNERPGRLDSTHRERPNGLLEEKHWKHDRAAQDTVRQRQLGSGSQRRDKVLTWKATTFQQLYLLLSLACAAQPTTGEVFWQAWLQRQSGDTTRSGATLVQVWKIQQKFRRDNLTYSFCSSGLREMHGM